MTSSRVVITGRVQGVGFRAWVAREARQRGLAGFVRNRGDGSVEAVFSGTAGALQEMIAACQTGPRLAKVRTVDASHVADDIWPDFSVRPDD